MAEMWLVTLPNAGASPAETLERLRLSCSCRGKEYASLHPVSMPRLPISSLDTLMALSDALGKVDRDLEAVVAKIEKQYKDTLGADREALLVDSQPVGAFVRTFEWNFAKYSVRADVKLGDIMEEIRRGVMAADEEVRGLAQDYNETQQKLVGLRRKKGGGVATAALEEFLTAPDVARIEKVDTDYLLTLVVLVPYNKEEAWLAAYEGLCPELAGYGGPDWLDDGEFGFDQPEAPAGPASGRQRRKGSPVVPGSARRITATTDTIIYAVTILKGQYEAGFFEGDEWQPGVFADFVEPFKREAKEHRFTVRDFDFNPERIGDSERQVAELEATLEIARRELADRCKVQFAETFEAMLHSKLVRGFVESVLRYGLVQAVAGEPPTTSFISVFAQPKHEGNFSKALSEFFTTPGAEGGDADLAEEDGDDEYTPYVCLKIQLVGAE